VNVGEAMEIEQRRPGTTFQNLDLSVVDFDDASAQ
jgi:hypothetical protein